MAVILTAQGVRKSFGLREILGGVSFAINDQDRVALVGVNGSGKSTLLSILVGAAAPDDGLVTRRRELRLEHVAQEPALDPDATVGTVLAEGLAQHSARLARLEALGARLHELDGIALEAALAEQAALHEQIAHDGGWERDHELRTVAAALDTPPMERIIGTLSIGERRRVALARALLARPDLLSLDEPTNHLDATTVAWLEERLRSFAGALLLVTHDRYFLDRVATRILELDRGRLYVHDGGYERFLERQAERAAIEATHDREREMFIRRELDWIRRGPSARGTKQQARIDRFDAVVEADRTAVRARGPLALRLSTGGRLGKTILELDQVSKSVNGKPLFTDLSLILKPGDRIGIVGPNGVGKSTLVRTILGQIAPDAGRVVVGQNTRFAFLDQARADLDDSRTVLDEVSGGNDHVFLEDGPVHVRTFLRMLLFDDRAADTPVGVLSGGERNRVQLAKLLRVGGNLLVLDEPTNDLDLYTLGVLEEALVEFGGCALVVSHDRWFLDRVATGILAFEGNGRVEFYEGSFDSYLRRRRAEHFEAAPVETVNPVAPPSVVSPVKSRKRSFKEQQELVGMEAAIVAAEARVGELEATLSNGSVYKERASEVPALVAALDAARRQVEQLYARWQELEST